MAQDTTRDYSVEQFPYFAQSSVTDEKAVHPGSTAADELWIFMMRIILIIAYGVIWTIDLFPRSNNESRHSA
ncbi:MAG: hypothetical protein PVF74_06530 [Anaerolineales bacterium]